MRLSRVRYWCSECADPFEVPDLTGDRGLLALRSAGLGTLRYVDPYADPIFAEVETFVGQHGATGRSDREIGTLIQRLFGVTVDPDEDGSPFVVGASPPCHGCGHIVRYEVVDPPEGIDVEIEPVAHDRWLALSESERLAKLEAELRDL